MAWTWPSPTHPAQLLGVEGDDGHGVAVLGGAHHQLPPVPTFMEQDAGAQRGVADELLIALHGAQHSEGHSLILV